jgi:hypothetical protein
MPAQPPEILFLLESPEDTMKCKEPGAYYLYDTDSLPRPRRVAKKSICGTELGSASNARLIVACKRHAHSGNLRLCVFGLGMKTKH